MRNKNRGLEELETNRKPSSKQTAGLKAGFLLPSRDSKQGKDGERRPISVNPQTTLSIMDAVVDGAKGADESDATINARIFELHAADSSLTHSQMAEKAGVPAMRVKRVLKKSHDNQVSNPNADVASELLPVAEKKPAPSPGLKRGFLAAASEKEKAKTQETQQSVDALIREGKIWSAIEMLGLTQKLDDFDGFPPNLKDAITEGISGEIVNDSLHVEDIPGKGKGYIANKNIQTGEVVLFDTAFVSSKEVNLCIPASMRNVTALLKKEKEYPNFYRTHIDTLARHDECKATSAVMGDRGAEAKKILDANVFGVDSRKHIDEGWSVLFPRASLFNHSCDPNAVVDASPHFGAVRAIRMIKKGEEVTVAYLDVFLSRAERQDKFDKRGFYCACSKCVAEEDIDPVVYVPCGCGMTWFSISNTGDELGTSMERLIMERLRIGTDCRRKDGKKQSSSQRCCAECGDEFEPQALEKKFKAVEEVNHFMRTREAQEVDPRELVQRLATVLEKVQQGPYGIPLTHPEVVGLLNYLSSCYLFVATRIGGGALKIKAAMFQYVKYRKMAVTSMEFQFQNSEVPPCARNYTQMLYRLVKVATQWPSKTDKKLWEKKYNRACMILYGQPSAPPALVSDILLN